jgi:hypothetical protein
MILTAMSAIVSHAWLVLDVVSMRLFVWLLGKNGELLDSHLFFFDRYSELADYHRARGRAAKAARLAAIAEAHYQSAPDDEPPRKTAAMAMPVPLPPADTRAVGTMPVKAARRAPERSSQDADVIQ